MLPDKGEVFSSWQLKWLIYTLVASAAGYLLFTIWGGWREVVQAIVTAGPLGIAVALSLSLLNYALRFLRWQTYLHRLGCWVPWRKSFQIYLAGFSLTTTPGKAGEALRSVYLKDYDLSYRKSLAAFFAERFSDLVAVLMISAFGIGLYHDGTWIALLTGAIVFLVFVVIYNKHWLEALERIAKSWLPDHMAHWVEFGLEMMLAFRHCYRIESLVVGIGLSVLAWMAEGVAFYTLLHLLGSQIPMLTAQFVYSFSLLIGAITLLPGGLGGAEVTMWQLLLFFGVPNSITVAVTILIRLTTLWFSVLLGLISVATLKTGNK
jgi:uncharacterized protein (TIRG00374 family)